METLPMPKGRHMMPVAEKDLDPRLQTLLGYWRARGLDGRLPARKDIDPLDLRPLLGNILMVDVVPQADGSLRFRYRLFGTEFVFYHGGDLTGHWLDDIANSGFRNELLGLYRDVVARREMRTLSYDYLVDGLHHRFQAVLLPLAADGCRVDIVLGCGVRVAVY